MFVNCNKYTVKWFTGKDTWDCWMLSRWSFTCIYLNVWSDKGISSYNNKLLPFKILRQVCHDRHLEDTTDSLWSTLKLAPIFLMYIVIGLLFLSVYIFILVFVYSKTLWMCFCADTLHCERTTTRWRQIIERKEQPDMTFEIIFWYFQFIYIF